MGENYFRLRGFYERDCQVVGLVAGGVFAPPVAKGSSNLSGSGPMIPIVQRARSRFHLDKFLGPSTASTQTRKGGGGSGMEDGEEDLIMTQESAEASFYIVTGDFFTFLLHVLNCLPPPARGGSWRAGGGTTKSSFSGDNDRTDNDRTDDDGPHHPHHSHLLSVLRSSVVHNLLTVSSLSSSSSSSTHSALSSTALNSLSPELASLASPSVTKSLVERAIREVAEKVGRGDGRGGKNKEREGYKLKREAAGIYDPSYMLSGAARDRDRDRDGRSPKEERQWRMEAVGRARRRSKSRGGGGAARREDVVDVDVDVDVLPVVARPFGWCERRGRGEPGGMERCVHEIASSSILFSPASFQALRRALSFVVFGHHLSSSSSGSGSSSGSSGSKSLPDCLKEGRWTFVEVLQFATMQVHEVGVFGGGGGVGREFAGGLLEELGERGDGGYGEEDQPQPQPRSIVELFVALHKHWGKGGGGNLTTS